MARHRTVSEAPAEVDEALLDRRSRWLELRLRLWGWARDPPQVPDFDTPMRRDLDRARALPPGAARRESIEAVVRAHLGDEVIDRLLRNGPGGEPNCAWAQTQANLARAHRSES